MNIAVTHRKTCRLCDSAKVGLALSLAPTPVAEKYLTKEELGVEQPRYPLDLYLCQDCGHVQMLDVIDPKFLFADYTYQSGNQASVAQHLDECAATTCAQYKVPAGALVVDVGSNDGSLLRGFKKRGTRVLGVDPAREIALKASASGIPTIPEFLSLNLARQIKKEHGPAQVVCAFNVFAHTDDLGGMAESIRELLAADGVFVFEISYLLDIIERMLLGTIFHEHLSHHSVKPMVQFLRRHGMELIDVRRVDSQGGALVGTAQLVGGPHAVQPSVGELLELERERGLDKPETLKNFGARLEAMRQELGTMMADMKRQGKTIWGYGAARSGTTLIAEMGLGEIISAIVDDHPDKQGKYSPGDKIPILPTKELYEQMPEYTFILAWIHSARIVANNQRYLDGGGHFIVCFPQIQIVGAGQKLRL